MLLFTLIGKDSMTISDGQAEKKLNLLQIINIKFYRYNI